MKGVALLILVVTSVKISPSKCDFCIFSLKIDHNILCKLLLMLI